MSWPQPTISGYNATPPADDGSQTASNVVAWATIVTKIGNPLKTLLKTTISTIANYLTPTGALMSFAGSSAPTGWLLCYGQTVSRSTYADLFAVIGTTYGTGDGTTTFNVPDLRGRSVFGKDDMGGSAASRITPDISGINGASLGAAGGDERLHDNSHTGGSHAHDLASHTHIGGAHGHTVSVNDGRTWFMKANNGAPGAGSVAAVAAGSGVIDNQPTCSISGNITASAGSGGAVVTTGPSTNTSGFGGAVSTSNSGGGTAAKMPPALVANWLIKT